MPRRKGRKDVDDTTRVTNLIFEILKKRGDKPLYPALRKRMNDIFAEVEDVAEIELVCLTIIDDSPDFTAWREFNWLHYEKIKESLEVPDDAWPYALWSYHLEDDPKLRDSVNHWLGLWYDASYQDDKRAIKEAKAKLELLWLSKNPDIPEVGY